MNEIVAAAHRIVAGGQSPERLGRDPVNLPTIRNWLEAMGDTNPVYQRDGVAPPAMAQVWTMRGLAPVGEDPDDPLRAISAVLDEAGYTSVVATNCEQTYHRYLRVGERVGVRSRLIDVSGPKRTALGEGWFVTTESSWYVGTEPVASMRFRILKFRPAAPAEPAALVGLRPVVSRDTAFFWAGAAAGELRVQRCGGCGALRHPPGPACPHCGAGRSEHVVATGTGHIYSYVVHHHPPLPGRPLATAGPARPAPHERPSHGSPVVVALVELDEGVRMVGEVRGADPDRVHIGAPVRVEFVRVDDELTLPAWRLRDKGSAPEGPGGGDIPEPVS